MRDIWPESLIAVGFEDSWAVKLLGKLAMFLYKEADQIIVVTNSFKKYLINKSIDKEKIAVITNGVDPEVVSGLAVQNELKSRLKLEGKFVVGYIGTHGRAHALTTIASAASLAAKEDDLKNLKFITLGNGEEYSRLKSETQHLDNFLMIGQVASAEVSQYWSICDLSIVHLRNSELFKTVIPSKIFARNCRLRIGIN